MADLIATLQPESSGGVSLMLSLPGPDGEPDPDAPRHRFVTASSEERALDWLQWKCMWTVQAAHDGQERWVEEFVSRRHHAETMKQTSKMASKETG